MYGGDDNAYSVLVATPEGKGHLKDVSIQDRIILKWILKQQDREGFNSVILLRMCTSGSIWCTQ
jgi:hypothetical protein